MVNGGKKEHSENPLITVITVVYNAEHFLEKTLNNVTGQTFNNFEFIIIDGDSHDGTLEIIKKYEDKIDYWQSEPDKGIYDAMNKGIALAKGQWLSFMNAGDTYYNEETLQNVASYLTKDADIVYGKALYHNGMVYSEKKVTTLMLMKGDMICHQSIFARKSTFENNLFDTDYKLIADKVWLCKCYKHQKIRRIDLPVCYYDETGQSSVNTKKLAEEGSRWTKKFFGIRGIFLKKYLDFRHRVKCLILRK